MNSSICNNCGTVCEQTDGVLLCPSCGATIAKNELPKLEKRLSAAFLLLRESQFDEAKTAFEAILKKYSENALAYWGRFRARYHITYVPNADGKQVPKCPTESGANVFEDTDYLKATEYASDEEKAFLQAQAERIKAFCTERTFSKNRVVRFTLGEVDPNDAFVMPPKSKKPLILSAVFAFILIAATSVCFATGVFHKHTPGMAATCTEDQICLKCNEVLMSATGHTPGAEANCTEAQYCLSCSVQLSAPFAHTPGAEATCTEAQTCTVCSFEMAPALGHAPGAEATCIEAQICTVCNTTLVSAFGHTPGTEATCTDAQNCSVCNEELVKALGHKPGAEATCTEAQICTVCDTTLVSEFGHTPGAEATCTTAQVCTLCNTQLVSAFGHTPGAAATCTTTQNCTVCNEKLTDALGHTAGAVATCTTAQTCTVCDATLIPALGHKPGAGVTCTEAQTCSVCNAVLEGALGHKPGPEATCTDEQTCTVCHAELAPALGHTPGAEATCTTPQVCTVCNTGLIKPLGHKPGAEATCTTAQNCTVCSAELVAALGHTPGAAATCTTAQACTACNAVLADATGHDHDAVITDPTCTARGYITYTCACGDTYISDYVDASGHTAQDGVCTVCGMILTEAHEHNYTFIVTDPTCTAQGYTTHTCACGDTYVSDYTNASGHTSGEEATCTTAQLCTVCNEVLAEETGHTPGAEATCTTAQVCTVCNEELAPETGHTPGAEATCTTAQVCTVCNTELAPETGHTPGAEATCTTAQVCTVCNTELAPKTGHTPGTEATCTTAQVCTVCNEELAPETGHTPGEWVIVTPATKTEDGLREQTCIACGYVNREVIPATGSEGLAYTENADGTYTVSGIGDCNDTDIVIPPTYNGGAVTSIGSSAFYVCGSLTSVVIPDGVTKIGGSAFQNCGSLTSISLPDSVTSIGSYAFSGCSSLTSVEIPNSVTSINNNAFYGCSSLTSITIPEGVTSIGSSAFRNCSSLTSVTIPNSVTSIGSDAFYYCTRLTSVTIPNSVTSIGSYAFSECTGLTSVTIPNSVTSIGSHTFRNCSSLTSVTIPNSVTSIGSGVFYGCTSLTEIKVDENNANYCDIDGVLFNKDVTKILCYPAVKTETTYAIPSGVTSIDSSAFTYCTGLTSVTIPNGVTSIGSVAFANCTGLTSIEIPNSVTSISSSAFANCTGLKSVEIPNSMTSTGSWVFANCTGLTSVTIPNSVTSIDSSVFRNCGSLTTITYGGTTAQWLNDITFNSSWNASTGDYTVTCTDGTVSKDGVITLYEAETVYITDITVNGTSNVSGTPTLTETGSLTFAHGNYSLNAQSGSTAGGSVTISFTVKNNSGADQYFAYHAAVSDSDLTELQKTVITYSQSGDDRLVKHGETKTFTFTIQNTSRSSISMNNLESLLVFSPNLDDTTTMNATADIAKTFANVLAGKGPNGDGAGIVYQGKQIAATDIMNEITKNMTDVETGGYTGNVGNATQAEKDLIAAIFGDNVIQIGNNYYSAHILIKNQQIDNQGENDMIVYVTADQLEIGGGTWNNRNQKWENTRIVPVYGLVFIKEGNGYKYCDHLFAGEAPVCDFGGALGEGKVGNFHVNLWNSTEFSNITDASGGSIGQQYITTNGELDEAYQYFIQNNPGALIDPDTLK